LRIFAAFLERGFLARNNSSGCTTPILHFLRCKKGVAPTYNLEVILAITLSYSVAHNYHDTPLTCGGIVTLFYECIEVDMNLSSDFGTKVDKVSILTLEVLVNMGILFNYTAELNYYKYMTANGDYTVTHLSRSELFNRTEGK
jgi:hypothetical protein